MQKSTMLVISAVLLALNISLLLFIPPGNETIVYGYIVLLALLAFFLVHIFAPLPVAAASLAGTFVFFTINYLVGFQLVNTALIISGIIGVSFLFKK